MHVYTLSSWRELARCFVPLSGRHGKRSGTLSPGRETRMCAPLLPTNRFLSSTVIQRTALEVHGLPDSRSSAFACRGALLVGPN